MVFFFNIIITTFLTITVIILIIMGGWTRHLLGTEAELCPGGLKSQLSLTKTCVTALSAAGYSLFPERPRVAGQITEMIGVWGCKEIWRGELR